MFKCEFDFLFVTSSALVYVRGWGYAKLYSAVKTVTQVGIFGCR